MKGSILLATVAAVTLGQAAPAKTITGEEVAEITSHLEACVSAMTDRSEAAFDGWEKQKGFVPVSFLTFGNWLSPDGEYRASFGQRGDRKGRPFICDLERLSVSVPSEALDARDRNIIDWVNGLDQVTLSGVTFARGAEFTRPDNASQLSACINSQYLTLTADVSRKATARIRINVPRGEILPC